MPENSSNNMIRATTIFLFVINIAFGQTSDLKQNNLKDSIASIHEIISSTPVSSEGSAEIISNNITYYNQKGFIEKVVSYRMDTVFSYCAYNYLNDSVLTRQEEYNYDNSIYLTINYTYSSNQSRKADYDRSFQKSYDHQRKSIDIEYEEYYKRLYTYSITQYDHKGYITEEKYYSQNGNPRFTYKYKYDYKYNRVEVKFYNNSGKLSWRKKLKYNTDGFVEQATLFLSNRIARKSTFSYETDNNENWTKCIEKRVLYDNFFADNLDDNTVITSRKINYY